MSLSHSEARTVLRAAFASRGLDPSPRELQAVQAVGSLESYYGKRYRNNWGNIQCGRKFPCPEGCVEGGDLDAQGVPYEVCFRVYDTPEEGAAALVQTLYKRPGVPEALKYGSAQEIADAMRATGYYEAPATQYGAGLASRAKALATELGEDYLLSRKADKGSKVPAVVVGAVGAFLLWRGLKKGD